MAVIESVPLRLVGGTIEDVVRRVKGDVREQAVIRAVAPGRLLVSVSLHRGGVGSARATLAFVEKPNDLFTGTYPRRFLVPPGGAHVRSIATGRLPFYVMTGSADLDITPGAHDLIDLIYTTMVGGRRGSETLFLLPPEVASPEVGSWAVFPGVHRKDGHVKISPWVRLPHGLDVRIGDGEAPPLWANDEDGRIWYLPYDAAAAGKFDRVRWRAVRGTRALALAQRSDPARFPIAIPGGIRFLDIRRIADGTVLVVGEEEAPSIQVVGDITVDVGCVTRRVGHRRVAELTWLTAEPGTPPSYGRLFDGERSAPSPVEACILPQPESLFFSLR